MKLFIRLKNKKGFTLVELLVTVVIFGLMMLAVIAFFQPVSRLVTGVRRDGRMDMVLDTIGDYIRRSTDITEKIEIYRISDPDLTALGMLPDFSDGVRGRTHAIYFCLNGRLFDFGDIEGLSYTELEVNILNDPDEMELRAVFNDEYYNDVMLNGGIRTTVIKHRFVVLPSGRGIRIAFNAYRDANGDNLLTDNEQATRERTTTYNFLNPRLTAVVLSPRSQDPLAFGSPVLPNPLYPDPDHDPLHDDFDSLFNLNTPRITDPPQLSNRNDIVAGDGVQGVIILYTYCICGNTICSC